MLVTVYIYREPIPYALRSCSRSVTGTAAGWNRSAVSTDNADRLLISSESEIECGDKYATLAYNFSVHFPHLSSCSGEFTALDTCAHTHARTHIHARISFCKSIQHIHGILQYKRRLSCDTSLQRDYTFSEIIARLDTHLKFASTFYISKGHAKGHARWNPLAYLLHICRSYFTLLSIAPLERYVPLHWISVRGLNRNYERYS